MNKLKESRLKIFFIKKKSFFANLHENIKLQVFPKLKLYLESPRNVVNKCAVTSCSTAYKAGQK